MIVEVSVVLRRTVCCDTDGRFDNVTGGHHQSQMNCELSEVGSRYPDWSTKISKLATKGKNAAVWYY